MKKFISILSVLALLMGLFTSCGRSDEERSKILKIYNWGDYIDEDVLTDFPKWYKEQTGEEVRIIYQVFDINEIMLTKIERGHEDFDLICPSEYILERMLRKNLLLPIDRNFGKTPDYINNVSPYIQEELNKLSQPGRKTTDYVVPYMWGTAGLLYNKADVSRDEVMSWKCLWDPRFRNKILMKDSYRDAYGTAIIYAHARELADGTITVEQLMNDSSPEMIAIAEEYLKKMKPNIGPTLPIELNTVCSDTNRSPGPPDGARFSENTAGKTASPASKAAKVSRTGTSIAFCSRSASFFIYEPYATSAPDANDKEKNI